MKAFKLTSSPTVSNQTLALLTQPSINNNSALPYIPPTRSRRPPSKQRERCPLHCPAPQAIPNILLPQASAPPLLLTPTAASPSSFSSRGRPRSSSKPRSPTPASHPSSPAPKPPRPAPHPPDPSPTTGRCPLQAQPSCRSPLPAKQQPPQDSLPPSAYHKPAPTPCVQPRTEQQRAAVIYPRTAPRIN